MHQIEKNGVRIALELLERSIVLEHTYWFAAMC